MKVYLIAHTCANGGNTAQAVFTAKSENVAKQKFRLAYPFRLISAVGVL